MDDSRMRGGAAADGTGDPGEPVQLDEALRELCPELVRFVAAARAEHVTHAAARLGVPQSTLSRSLARTQQASGAELFSRRGRGLALTRNGRRLLPRVERALAEVAEGLREVREESRGPGTVGLGFQPAMGEEAVPELLSGFRRQRPGVRFRLRQGNAEELLELLRGGEVDLCLTSPPPTDPDLECRVLGEEPLCLVVPSGHRLAARPGVRRAGIALAEAAGEEFVGLTPSLGLRRATDQMCRAAGFEPRVAFEGTEIVTVRGLVAAGLGIAILPAARNARAQGVVELSVTDPGAARRIALAWPRGRAQAPAVRAFRRHVTRPVDGEALHDAPEHPPPFQ